MPARVRIPERIAPVAFAPVPPAPLRPGYAFITAPDGTTTRSGPVSHPAHIIDVVANNLRLADPAMDHREADRCGLLVARHGSTRDWVHIATGYRFRITTERA